MPTDKIAENLNDLAYFGLEVSEARASRNMKQKHLAAATGYSEGYVSKVENGVIPPSEKFASGCDRVFNTNGYFVRMLRRIEGEGHPSWFVPYLNLERRAERVLDFSVASIMGILQTDAYARAIFRAGYPKEAPGVINGRVAARMKRRDVMAVKDPPELWVILHEACLRTPVGGREVMTGQLRHLLTAAASPHVDLQVLPFTAGAVAAHTLPYTLLTFTDSPTVLWTDGPQGGRIYHKSHVVGQAQDNNDRLRANALALHDSLDLIKSLLEEGTP